MANVSIFLDDSMYAHFDNPLTAGRLKTTFTLIYVVYHVYQRLPPREHIFGQRQQ